MIDDRIEQVMTIKNDGRLSCMMVNTVTQGTKKKLSLEKLLYVCLRSTSPKKWYTAGKKRVFDYNDNGRGTKTDYANAIFESSTFISPLTHCDQQVHHHVQASIVASFAQWRLC